MLLQNKYLEIGNKWQHNVKISGFIYIRGKGNKILTPNGLKYMEICFILQDEKW